jgi:hypothetical protein
VGLGFCFCKGSSIGTGKSSKAVFDSVAVTLRFLLDNIYSSYFKVNVIWYNHGIQLTFFLRNRVYISHKVFGGYIPNLTRTPLREKKITAQSL